MQSGMGLGIPSQENNNASFLTTSPAFCQLETHPAWDAEGLWLLWADVWLLLPAAPHALIQPCLKIGFKCILLLQLIERKCFSPESF